VGKASKKGEKDRRRRISVAGRHIEGENAGRKRTVRSNRRIQKVVLLG